MLPVIIFPFSFYTSSPFLHFSFFFILFILIIVVHNTNQLYCMLFLFNFSVHESDEAHNAEIEILVSKIEEAKTEISDISETLAR